MRVAHICPAVFTDGLTYQENLLARQHHLSGHDVIIIAPTEQIDSQTRLVQCAPGWSKTTDGIPLLRLPHPRLLPVRIAQKVRWMRGLRAALDTFRPDAALFHAPQSLSLLTFRNYQRRNPTANCHVDCHSDPYTSGTRWLSRNVLHRCFYGPLVRFGMRGLEPLLCISIDVQQFVSELYGFHSSNLAFFPLGGFVLGDHEYNEIRKRGRDRLGLRDGELLFLQTGKMDRRKRLIETLHSFRRVAIPNARFVVAGSLADDTRELAERAFLATPNAKFLGWVDSQALTELLCACDLYVQPGSQSATMQMALCSRCPVILDDVASHGPFVRGNGWIIRGESGLYAAFQEIRRDPSCLSRMSLQSLEIAKTLLDYSRLAERILQPRRNDPCD